MIAHSHDTHVSAIATALGLVTATIPSADSIQGRIMAGVGTVALGWFVTQFLNWAKGKLTK